jgi:GH25 family lysozyme M1 (1,4-beta-N-acetylmuramidase)
MRTKDSIGACALTLILCACGTTGDEELTESGDALSRCANGATVEGIDISHWQGEIDWDAVAGAGKEFAFIAIGDGFFVDPRFDENWAGAKDAGLYRGVYQYFRASADPIAQANIVIDRVGRLGPGELPVVLDLEEFDGMSASTVRLRALEWMRHIEQGTGKTPILYTNPATWIPLGEPTGFVGYPLWLASWGVSCPGMANGWHTWTFHQYSATGRVAGIWGDVDLDRFNGSIDVLRTLAGLGPSCIFGDGVYCGGNGVVGDPRTLYRCAGGRATREELCAMGCASMPAGQDDRCRATNECPVGDGLYCGGDLIGGGRRTLYRCTEGKIALEQTCANSCVWEPVGSDDRCN